MKTQIDIKLAATLVGGLLFNFLFWNEELGINVLLHSLFILFLFLIDPEIKKSKKFWLIISSHLLAAVLLVYNNSVVNFFGYYISLFVLVGFTYGPLLRSVLTALFAGWLQLITSPIQFISRLIKVKVGNFSLRTILRPLKYIIIPFFILLFFSIIYSIANPVFGNYFEQTFDHIGTFINKIFTFLFGDLSFDRFMHVILGILFTAGLLLPFKNNFIQSFELKLPEQLRRKSKDRILPIFIYELKDFFIGFFIKKKMALKTENIIGIISFAALNLLLLALNTLDISTLWLGNASPKNYSAELHDGTNALIVSIFMAMGVILFFFSGNLNFFSKNKTIRTLAYLWILQNVFLVASVFLRDYHYIAMHGLTHKRIGVIVFLILCLAGLISIYVKVAKLKTMFFLCKVNSLIWYVLLLTAGFINWDVLIVSYNINNRDQIALDLDHIMEMSDKTLPLIDQNSAVLKNYLQQSNYALVTETEVVPDSIAPTSPNTTDSIAHIVPSTNNKSQEVLQNRTKQIAFFEDDVNHRIEQFKKKMASTTWLSWNYRDWQTYQYFTVRK